MMIKSLLQQRTALEDLYTKISDKGLEDELLDSGGFEMMHQFVDTVKGCTPTFAIYFKT